MVNMSKVYCPNPHCDYWVPEGMEYIFSTGCPECGREYAIEEE